MTTGHRQPPHQNPSGGYTHDDLHRLTDLQRGDLDGTHPDYTGIADTPDKIETFTLDQLGNWNDYDVTIAGFITNEQDRTFNQVNEITGITGDLDWEDPTYDPAGNMTRAPLGRSDGGIARRYRYDAWNRMVESQTDSQNTVATLEYDGLNRMIRRVENSETFDHYYNRDWQMLETHRDDTLHWQHVWSQRYIDAPVLWDRDTDGDGQFDRRYYFATDANMNVTALFDDAGVPKERYTYDAYGNPRMRFANFNEQGNNQSNHDNHWLFAGYFKLPQDAYHVRNRMYHPTLGAWMQRDPLEYVDGAHLHVAYNVLLGRPDPLGLSTRTRDIYRYTGETKTEQIEQHWEEYIAKEGECCWDIGLNVTWTRVYRSVEKYRQTYETDIYGELALGSAVVAGGAATSATILGTAPEPIYSKG